jgi:hypothetical protein
MLQRVPLIAALLCALCATVGAAQSHSPTPAPERSDFNAIRLSVESNQASYSSGAAVYLRFTITNTTSKPYAVRARYPSDMIFLTIRNSDGQYIQPTDKRHVEKYEPMAEYVSIEPGKSLFRGPQDPEWINIADWGYGPLLPGTYKIKAVLHTEAILHRDNEPPADRFLTFDQNHNGSTSTVLVTIEP